MTCASTARRAGSWKARTSGWKTASHPQASSRNSPCPPTRRRKRKSSRRSSRSGLLPNLCLGAMGVAHRTNDHGRRANAELVPVFERDGSVDTLLADVGAVLAAEILQGDFVVPDRNAGVAAGHFLGVDTDARGVVSAQNRFALGQRRLVVVPDQLP